MMIRILEERCVDLHLASEDRFKSLFHVIPGRNVLWSRGKFAVLGDHAKLLLTSESFLTNLVPAVIEFALVLCDPVCRDVVRSVSRSGGKVDEKWLVGSDRLLLVNIGNCLVSQVLHQVIAL